MPHLNNSELQNIRHIMLEEQVTADKADFFVSQVSNPQLKSHLDQKARMCRQNVQQLNQFISQY
ncbi:MAG: hypothetical protein ACOC4G_08865 [Bacillota bacterium]